LFTILIFIPIISHIFILWLLDIIASRFERKFTEVIADSSMGNIDTIKTLDLTKLDI
jgi:uncharacterized membrane protein